MGLGTSEQPGWPVVAGSMGATVAVLGGLILLMWVGRSLGRDGATEPLRFAPGQLVALGSIADATPGGRPDPTDAPPADDTRAPALDEPETPSDPAETPSDSEPDAVSTDATAPRIDRDDHAPSGGKPPRHPDAPPSSSSPSSSPMSHLPTSPLPSLAKPGQGGGQTTGSPKGFSDRLVDGDAWATDVLRALSNAPVGTFGGELPSGTLRFELEVCADGRIKRIRRIGAGSTISDDGADRVVLAISRVELERPPADVRAAMAGSCRKLDYTFAWTASGVQ